MKFLHGLVDGQVLQRLGSRGANVILQGQCPGPGEITAEISQNGKPLKGWSRRSLGQTRGGKFTVKLNGIPAGGPYQLALRIGPETATVKSFYVGDVWLMAGQSNMEGVGNLSAPAKPHPLIRAFSMRREWKQARDPLHTLAESPDFCHHGGRQLTVAEIKESIRNRPKGVGVGLFFARDMFERSGVPQGLIATAHGGTSMAQWNPALKSEGGKSLYYSMLESFKATGQPIAGVLWYQGESDANPNDASLYLDRMKKLVAATRRDFRQPALPWVVVQIGRFAAAGNGKSWNRIQELQRILPSRIRHLETVSAIDLPLDDSIHISSEGYARLGRRVAASAARLVLGDKRELPQPNLHKLHPPRNLPGVGWTQDVEFTNLRGRLISAGEPQGFAFVNANHEVVPAIYRITLHGNIARLHLGRNPEAEGLLLGYGMGFNPYCNVTDERGFSLPVFGPREIGQPRALSPFLAQWKVSDVVSNVPALNKIAKPDVAALPHRVKAYPDNNFFVNEHENWNQKSGHAYFSAVLELSEPMDLKFLMGYDGPFRVWVNGKAFFQDLKGTNPALVDSKNRSVKLKSGRHEIVVAMDINYGRAWGFFLRFQRNDVAIKDVRENRYTLPTFSV